MVRRSGLRFGGLRHILQSVLLFEVSLGAFILRLGYEFLLMGFLQKVEFEFEPLRSLLILVLLLPLGNALSQKFLTAKLFRALDLLNLHLVVVPFLGSLIVSGLHLFEILDLNLEKFLL